MSLLNYASCCPNCGGTLVGDGYTLVRHCETVDVYELYAEPDAGPIYCTDNLEDADEIL